MLNKMAIPKFWYGGLGKNERGRGLGALQFFGHIKRALELLISASMNPLAKFLDHWVDTITPGEKKYKIPHFCR